MTNSAENEVVEDLLDQDSTTTESIAVTSEVDVDIKTTLATNEFEYELTTTTEGGDIQDQIANEIISTTITEQIQTTIELEDNKLPNAIDFTTQIPEVETTTLTTQEAEIFEKTSSTISRNDDIIILPDCDALDQFECGVGKCVPHEKVCDGILDCENGLDEAECNHDFEEETFQNSFTPKKEATIQNQNDVN